MLLCLLSKEHSGEKTMIATRLDLYDWILPIQFRLSKRI